MDISNLLTKESNQIKNSLAVLLNSTSLLCDLLDADTKRYCAVSNYSVATFGISEEFILKQTTDEIIINCNVQSVFNKKWARVTNQMNEIVCHTKKPLKHQVVMLGCDGLIKIIEVSKVPILARHQKVILIMDHAHDLTEQQDLLSLLSLYLKNYADQSNAIRYFLKYLALDRYFTELPTIQELHILLAAYFKETHKRMISQYDRGCKNIYEDVEQLNSKIETRHSLEDIFSTMDGVL